MDPFYGVYARHYDSAYDAKQDLVDLPFYVEAATNAAGPVLEIGCGTGRILFAAARAGVMIDGVDYSADMLAIARAKRDQEPAEVQARVRHLEQGDMRGFRLGREYALVTIPFRPLQEFWRLDDQLAALVTAKAHLMPGGRLAFDVFYPHYQRLLGGIGEALEELTWTDPQDPTRRVTRYFRKQAVDVVNQYFVGEFLLRWRAVDGPADGPVLEEAAMPFQMSWYTPTQMQLLLRLAGLRIVESFGSFDRSTAIGDGTEQIYVCEPT